jgi:hypothetical protein
MKRTRTFRLQTLLYAAAFYAVALASPSAKANLITGSIGFGADGVTVNSSSLASATSFEVASPFTTTETGDYVAVPLSTSISFTGFVFNPPAASVTPLWTFDVGSTVYSFDATSVSSFYNPTLEQWDIGGNGLAMITGFGTTKGTWNVNLSQSGESFVFDASSASVASVADNNTTITLLGGAFIGLAALGRKARR